MVRATNITLTTANTTITDGLFTHYLVNAGTGNTGVTSFTITLPPITSDGMHYQFTRVDTNGTGTVTIQASDPDTIVQNLGLTGTTGAGSTGPMVLFPQYTMRFHSYNGSWYNTHDDSLLPPMFLYFNSGSAITSGSVFLRQGSTLGTESGAQILIPRNGILSDLYVALTASPGSTGGATGRFRTFNVRLNNGGGTTGTTGTIGFTILATGTTGADTTNTMFVTAGQSVSLLQTTSASGAGTVPAGAVVIASLLVI